MKPLFDSGLPVELDRAACEIVVAPSRIAPIGTVKNLRNGSSHLGLRAKRNTTLIVGNLLNRSVDATEALNAYVPTHEDAPFRHNAGAAVRLERDVRRLPPNHFARWQARLLWHARFEGARHKRMVIQILKLDLESLGMVGRRQTI
jgi:hypothetical protein